MKPVTVLALNSGSSSLKLALFECAPRANEGTPDETRIAEGAVEGIGQSGGRFWLRADAGGVAIDRPEETRDHAAAVSAGQMRIDRDGG